MSKKQLAAAIKKRQRRDLEQCIDPFKPKSRPTEKQAEVLNDIRVRIQYVVAGNQSGKSALGGRMTAWYFEENYPNWERPNSKECWHCKSTDFKYGEDEYGVETTEVFSCNDCGKEWVDWGDEPLTLIVAGKVTKQNKALWEKKIKPFLKPGSYKVNKQGSTIESIDNLENGNQIIFLSHDKAIVSKEKVQSYVAHFVWIDEMPDHYAYIEEALQRTTSKRAKLIMTCTPKTSNPEVKDMVEAVDARVGKKYKFGKLDNPINRTKARMEEIEAELAGLSESVRNCILYGDWLDADDSVFSFDRSLHCKTLTEYSTSREHCVSYDPAANGKGGLIIAVRTDRGWHVKKAEYIKGGKAPSDNILDIDKKLKPYTYISRKIYDCHEAWFYLEHQKLKNEGKLDNRDPWTAIEKHGRKKELITQLQQAMLDGWLTFDPGLNDLFNEFTSAQWATGRDDKIQGSQHYHLLDALQYLVDLVPKKKEVFTRLNRDQQLMRQMEKVAFTPKPKSTPTKVVRGRRGRRR